MHFLIQEKLAAMYCSHTFVYWFFFFLSDTTDFNAYGPKITANDGETFLIQFSPYNYTFDMMIQYIMFIQQV